MNRIDAKFIQLRRQRKKALIPFIVGGYPNLATTGRLLPALEKVGADLIELGIPFSDPMADGPVIQRAYERALRRRVTLAKILKLVGEVRSRLRSPIVLMGYYNPIFAYGLKRFARDGATVGVDGVLVVDLPPEEAGPLHRELELKKISLIRLVAPTSTEGRLVALARGAEGYLYYVSMTGITGARLTRMTDIARQVREIRKWTRCPVVVGFGIRTPQEARRVASVSDGVVVGSELVKRLAGTRGRVGPVLRLVRRLRRVV